MLTLYKAQGVMNNLRHQFDLSDDHVRGGMAIFKLASANNFVQGRRIDMVAASCLYTFCRTVKPCKVMLIDFADKIPGPKGLGVSCMVLIKPKNY